MRCVHFRTTVVEFVPEELEDCILYVSQAYGTAVHKRACGCGEEVVTPLGATDWSYEQGRRGPTLYPSIGNWNFACRSHYFIRNGSVIIAQDMSAHEIERLRAQDRAAKEAYFASARTTCNVRDKSSPQSTLVTLFTKRLKRWLSP